MTKAEVLSAVKSSPSSIFSRVDVVNLVDAISDGPPVYDSAGFTEADRDMLLNGLPDSIMNGTSVLPATLTEEDLESICDDIAKLIAHNADDYIDHSDIELSIDYDRCVSIDRIGMEEHALSSAIYERIEIELQRRGFMAVTE